MDDDGTDRAVPSPTRFLRDDDDDAAAAAATADGAQPNAHSNDDVDYLLHPDLSLSALSTLVSPPRARPNKRRDRDLESSPRASPRRGIIAQTPQSSPRGSPETAAAAAASSQPKRVRFQSDEAQTSSSALSAQTTNDAQPTQLAANSGSAEATAGAAAVPPAASSAAAAAASSTSAPASDDGESPALLRHRPSFLFFRAAHYAKLKAAFPELSGFQCSKLGEPLVSLRSRPETLMQPVTAYLPAPTPTAQPAAAATSASSLRPSRMGNAVLAQAVPMGVVVASESVSADAPVVAVATSAPAPMPLYYPCPTVGQGNDELSRLLGAEWRALTPEQKRPYDDLAAQDRARYFAAKAQQSQKAASAGSGQAAGGNPAPALVCNPNAR